MNSNMCTEIVFCFYTPFQNENVLVWMWPQFPCISSMVVVVGAMLQFYLPVDHSVFLVLPLGCPRVGNLLNSTHTQ